MSAARRGLGRGLGALLGDERSSLGEGGGLRQLRVDAIRPNPQQPRQTFDPSALAELEQSIRELGVLVPVLVRPLSGDLFELIAGERRWRAAAAALLETIPAIVREHDDRSSLELALVENLQRENLDPLEEAMGLQHLIDKYGLTQEQLAQRIGKGRPTIANALRLLALSDPIKAQVRAGAISAGHARALLALDPAEREAVAQRIARDGLSVRVVERLGTHKTIAPPRGTRSGARKAPDVEAVESRMRYRLGAPVAIVSGPSGGGRIEIRFSDPADLTRIVDVILEEGP
jgi:ParB family transcriptional regulator, chromosome partitioning protein